MSKNIREELNADTYTNKLSYPSKTDADYLEKRAAYGAHTAELEAKFKVDLEAHFGTTGHPKADKLYAIAWAAGHPGGYHDVFVHYESLVELVL